MSKNKLTLAFEGLSQMMEKLESLEGNVKDATEIALTQSRDYVNSGLRSAMTPHNQTRETVNSLKDSKVKWTGSVAEIGVGFDLENGGLPSVFLMYGTPRITPDKNLYNAIYGSKTKKQIANIQQSVFSDAVREAMK